MSKKVEAIFLDTGNTMRIVEKDPVSQYEARQQIVKLLGAQESPDDFCKTLFERYETYKRWAKETLIQASETELWTRWMLPGYPAEKISPLSEQLTRLWMEQMGRRVPRPDVKSTIIELHERGYVLGIIANSISKTDIPNWLKADGLTQYFKAVVVSAQFGRRKPDPYIFLEATRLAGVEPARSVYVGDNPSRDIEGARQAGFSAVYILLEQATLIKEPPKGRFKPDGIIRRISDLLQFFPSAKEA